MDPLTIATTAITIGGVLWTTSNKLFGTPEWAKYVDAGIYVAKQALVIIAEAKANPGKYDKMTPLEIQTLLLPKTWEQLEVQALAELAAEGFVPED